MFTFVLCQMVKLTSTLRTQVSFSLWNQHFRPLRRTVWKNIDMIDDPEEIPNIFARQQNFSEFLPDHHR